MRFTFVSQRINGLDAGPVHDVTCIGYLIAPEIFTLKPAYTEIDVCRGPGYGRTVCDMIGRTEKEPNTLVGVTLDLEKFWELVYDTIKKYD